MMEETIEVLPRPHLRDEHAVKAAKARLMERCRQLAHLAHEIEMEARHWRIHPLPKVDDLYLAQAMDAIEAARRKPQRCPLPGPEPKIMEAAE